MNPPHGRPKDGSLPLGGKARSAKRATVGPPPGIAAARRTFAALLTGASILLALMPLAQAQLVADFASPDIAKEIVAEHAAIAPPDADGFAPVRFNPSGSPRVNLLAGVNDWDWSKVGEIRMHVQNAMAWPITVNLRVTDRAGAELNATVGLPPGGPITLTLPLQPTQPKRWGMTAGPPIPWLQEKAPVAVALTATGGFDRRHAAKLSIGMPRPPTQQTLRVGKIFIEPAPPPGDRQERLAYTGIVDAYGQYTRGEWEEKYRHDTNGAESTNPPSGPVQGGDSAGNSDASGRSDGAGSNGGGSDPRFAAFARAQERGGGTNAASAGTGPRLDEYGGLLDVDLDRIDTGTTAAISGSREKQTSGSGFFRTAKVRDADGRSRWLLLTPLGNPFFSLGVNAIQLENSETFVEGREFMFDGLPQAGDALARFAGERDSADELPLDAGAQRGRGYGKGRTYDFYRANLFRRDGEDFAAQWLARSRDRLKRWNFNTIGSWSDADVSDNARIPYPRMIHVAGDFSRLSDGRNWWAGIADPFDPRFAQALDRAVREEAAPRKDDPFLVGYFVDNELGWGDGASRDPRVRYALAYSVLAGDAREPHAHAKRALIELLRSRHDGSIENLSRSWRKTFASWEALQEPIQPKQLPDGRIQAVAADLAAFLSLHAGHYFEQVAAALKRHDPNHLYLGPRFASRNPEALAACAQWCDVVSFNLYLPSLNVGFETDAFRKLDKPAMLTEFHFGSSDRGPFWHGVMPVPSEKDRGPAYAQMLESVLGNPDFVGAHWFQYLDQPVTGRWLDGENGHLGLVAITDIPWKGFVGQVSETNRRVLETLRERLKPRR